MDIQQAMMLLQQQGQMGGGMPQPGMQPGMAPPDFNAILQQQAVAEQQAAIEQQMQQQQMMQLMQQRMMQGSMGAGGLQPPQQAPQAFGAGPPTQPAGVATLPGGGMAGMMQPNAY